MMHFSKTLKTTALASLFGLGFVLATTSPALADRAYTRCDRDGDRCYRVVCDNDGDRCRTYRVNANYYGSRGYYDRDRYNGYYGRDYYRDRDNYNTGYRHWVCDRDGDDCHWSYGRW